MKLKKGIKLTSILCAMAVTVFTDFHKAYALTYDGHLNIHNREVEKLKNFENDMKDVTIKEPISEKNTLESNGNMGTPSHISQAKTAFEKMLNEYELYGTLAHDVEFPVYQEASSNSESIKTLTSGYQVKLTDIVWNEAAFWFNVCFAVNDTIYSGYIQSEYVVSSDSRLNEWKSQFLPSDTTSSLYRAAGDASAFPVSYRNLIQKLIQAHPNWTFVPMNTGLEWEAVLAAEMEDSRNLVELDSPDTWKSTNPKDYNMQTGKWIIKNGTNWVQASKSIVKYYLDPRNFLTEESVFQFEQLVYGKHHTEDGVEKIIKDSFMSRKELEDGSADGITYAQAFMKIGMDLKVSPYFLASRVRQEQGSIGDSDLISGKYPEYKGYYNYFNRGATGIGQEVIINGLKEAKSKGWNTRYKALKGGAKDVSSDYIYKGQDTFYLQKFDVDASHDGLYWHQYMQNLLAADNEGKRVQEGYKEIGILDNDFVFKIPVYKNMPDSPCPKPEETLSKPNLKIEKVGYASAKLSWNETAAAQGYQIYRAEGKNGAYKKIASTQSDVFSYNDTSVIPGKTYHYKVRAYIKFSSGNKYSAFSDIKSADFVVPATTWNTFKVKNYRTIQLSWKKKSVDGYKIYRKTGKGKYRCIKTITEKSSSSFKDTSIKPGSSYTYRIRGYVSAKGKLYYSSYTNVKTAEVKMAKPKLKKVSVSGKKKIKLNWKRDSKADGYYIYRSSSEKKNFRKIKNISKNKTVKWSDTNVKGGKTYYYKIRSYIKTSAGIKTSGYSEVFNIKIKK